MERENSHLYQILLDEVAWHIITISSGNGLLSDGTKPLPEPLMFQKGLQKSCDVMFFENVYTL